MPHKKGHPKKGTISGMRKRRGKRQAAKRRLKAANRLVRSFPKKKRKSTKRRKRR